jgi:hypothetical protein
MIDALQKMYRRTHITKKTKIVPPSDEATFFDVLVEEKVSFVIILLLFTCYSTISKLSNHQGEQSTLLLPCLMAVRSLCGR